MNPGLPEEVGQTTRSFFEVMKESPLALGLIVSNFILLGYLFYSGSVIIEQRNETTKMIVSWQKETDQLMAGCISKDALQLVLEALNRANPPIRVPPGLQHLLPPDMQGPKLQSDESRPVELPPIPSEKP
jgi:hypothetical protein